ERRQPYRGARRVEGGRPGDYRRGQGSEQPRAKLQSVRLSSAQMNELAQIRAGKIGFMSPNLMTLFTTLRVALLALSKNKMRSGLTALGIIIGVGAVIAMVGIGNGAKAQVESQIASLGQNVIQVSPGSTSSRGVRQGADTAVTLTVDDAEAIAEEIP